MVCLKITKKHWKVKNHLFTKPPWLWVQKCEFFPGCNCWISGLRNPLYWFGYEIGWNPYHPLAQPGQHGIMEVSGKAQERELHAANERSKEARILDFGPPKEGHSIQRMYMYIYIYTRSYIVLDFVLRYIYILITSYYYIVLKYVIWCCIILQILKYVIFYYIMLHPLYYFVLHCIKLYYIVSYSIMLYHIIFYVYIHSRSTNIWHSHTCIFVRTAISICLCAYIGTR